jgi:phenylacetate-CoA ligase
LDKRIHDASLENLSPGEVRSLQTARMTSLLGKVSRENAFYRARWEAAGVKLDSITTLEKFAAEVPTIEKRDFVEDQQASPPFGLRHQHALGLRHPLIVSNTSGTSGQGVEIHAQTAEEFAGTGHIYGFHMRWSGLEKADGIFLTLPITLMSGGRCEFQGATAFGLTVYPVGNYDARRKLELMERYRPAALFGTTSYFGHLAAVAGEAARTLGLRALLTGGEGSGFAWLERLEESWGAKIYDRYGSTQTGNDHMFCCEAGIGTAARPGMLHNIDPMVLAEVIDPKTGRHVRDGEAGEIIVTSLYHTDTPLIRCRTRDRGVWHEPRYCTCGRPFSGVEVASISRLDDMKKVKGVNIWPQAVDDVLFAEALVDEYQVLLASDSSDADVATVRVMPKRALGEEDASRWHRHLTESLSRRIGITFGIEILAPGGLARSEYKAKRWQDERGHAQSRKV